MVAGPWRNATWLPAGAVAAPKLLPLAAKPEPLKVVAHAAVNADADASDSIGLYQNDELPSPDGGSNGDAGVSKPPSARSVGSASSTLTASIKAVLSATRRPTKRS